MDWFPSRVYHGFTAGIQPANCAIIDDPDLEEDEIHLSTSHGLIVLLHVLIKLGVEVLECVQQLINLRSIQISIISFLSYNTR